MIIPIAIYASETWTLKADDIRKLLVFENDCLRTMTGRRRNDRYRLNDIRAQLKYHENIVNMIKNRRLTWFGHVTRRGVESHVYRALKEDFPGKRPKGRPPKRWTDQVRKDTNMPLLTLERMAQDRVRWKTYVNEKCARI